MSAIDIDKIITRQLESGRRLIIPGFGAFIYKDDKDVVFVPFLKKNDGVLVSLLVSQGGLKNHEAEIFINDFVGKIREAIDSKGSFSIQGLGVLKNDSAGKIYLSASGTGTASMAATGTAPEKPVPSAASAPRLVASETAPTTNSKPAVHPAPAQTGAAINRQIKPPRESDWISSRLLDDTEDSRPNGHGHSAGISHPAQQAPQPRRDAGMPSAQSGQADASRPALQPVQVHSGRPPHHAAQQSRPANSGQPPHYTAPQPGRGRNNPVPPQRRPVKQVSKSSQPTSKADKFMIVAIIVAVLALAAIIYGVVSTNNMDKMESILPPAADTVQVE